jgi:hypothetical protein
MINLLKAWAAIARLANHEFEEHKVSRPSNPRRAIKTGSFSWLVRERSGKNVPIDRSRANLARSQTLYERPLFADIVEKLESPRRSQSRRPLAGSMEISLGAQRSDRSFCVRPSLRPRCGNCPRREHYARGSGIFAAPQFPTFSTISARSGPLVKSAVRPLRGLNQSN